MEWSKEYCMISHLGEFSIQKLWVTVERFNDGSADLKKWYPGCQFTPTIEHFSTVKLAKLAGEALLNQPRYK